MGEVSDPTVSLCALCSGAVAAVAVSLTAADVRARPALHWIAQDGIAQTSIAQPVLTVSEPTLP
jgi:hypothetical protein